MLISERVKKVVSEQVAFNVTASELTPETHFSYDLGCSLDFVEVIMGCEEESGIQIPDEEAAQLETVGKLIDYIQSRLEPDGKIWPPAPKASPPVAKQSR